MSEAISPFETPEESPLVELETDGQTFQVYSQPITDNPVVGNALFQAIDSLGRKVVLKTHMGGDLETNNQRILQEGRMAARDSRGGAISVFEARTTTSSPAELKIIEGSEMIVMPLYDKENFATSKEYIAKKQLPPEALASVAVQLCDTIADLTSKNTYHRDIKPDNIFLQLTKYDEKTGRNVFDPQAHETVILTDFGEAEEYLPGETQSRRESGSMAYFSPEKMSQFNFVDTPASEMWAATATLYELATGEKMIKSREPNALAAEILSFSGFNSDHGKRRLEDLEISLARLPEANREAAKKIFQKATAQRSENRYQHIRRFGDDLRIALTETDPEKVATLMESLQHPDEPMPPSEYEITHFEPETQKKSWWRRLLRTRNTTSI